MRLASWTKRTLTTYDVNLGGHVRVTVHRHRDYDPEAWLCTCYDLQIERHMLDEKDLAGAQAEAVRYCRDVAAVKVQALEAFSEGKLYLDDEGKTRIKKKRK